MLRFISRKYVYISAKSTKSNTKSNIRFSISLLQQIALLLASEALRMHFLQTDTDFSKVYCMESSFVFRANPACLSTQVSCLNFGVNNNK